MLIPRSLPLLILSSLLAPVLAANPFTYPTSGSKVTIGQETEIKWNVALTNGATTVGLSVCRSNGQDCANIASSLDNTGSYTWTPSASMIASTGYFLNLAGDFGFIGSSNPFTLQSASDSSSSSSGPTSVSSGSGGPGVTNGASTTTRSSATGSSTPTPGGSGSNSNGAVIGGAVAAVVIVIVIAVLAFICMRKRNQKKLAEARRGADDAEAGEKGPNGSSTLKKSNRNSVPSPKSPVPTSMTSGNADDFSPKDGYSEAASIPLAELPAMQQEAVEMAAVPAGGQQFFAMELDSREIPRPGTSTVRPDVDTSAAKPSMDKGEARGVSIDGTTVNSETERPRTAGSIEQIKEESREGSSSDLAQNPRSMTPAQEPRPSESHDNAGPSDGTPQLSTSIPRLPAFDFDSAKF